MICPSCKKLKTIWHDHHLFHNVAWARKIYGALINHPKNKMRVCADCNTSHAGIGLTHWTERQFCQELGIEIKSKVKY